MKLFSGFDAVKFQEENLIFITHDSYLYYIYYPKNNSWRKYRNAGNDCLTLSNYPDVSIEEITVALGGKYPQKETDFIRLCFPSCLCIRDMMDLMDEDYPQYMANYVISEAIHRLLFKSDIVFKSYLKVKDLMDRAISLKTENKKLLSQILELSYSILGRDLYKKEIGIVDGHDSSSFFWIQPVRIIDDADTDNYENVAKMRSAEISIEEDDVNKFLTPFLYKYFDEGLEANEKRGGEDISGFEWNLTHNFYTFDSIKSIIRDMKDTMDALTSGRKNEYTKKLKLKKSKCTGTLLTARIQSEDQIQKYHDEKIREDSTDVELVVDFYRRFIYRMEYMLQVGKENGYNLICFMGP